MGGRGYQFILLRHNTRAMKTAIQELIDKIILESNSDKPTFQQKYILIWVKYMAEELLEKEKEQIIKAHNEGIWHTEKCFDEGEEYYNQTYNQNK